MSAETELEPIDLIHLALLEILERKPPNIGFYLQSELVRVYEPTTTRGDLLEPIYVVATEDLRRTVGKPPTLRDWLQRGDLSVPALVRLPEGDSCKLAVVRSTRAPRVGDYPAEPDGARRTLSLEVHDELIDSDRFADASDPAAA